MRVIAALQADLEETMLGTRSRLADELAGETVLRRTVSRISRARRIDAVFVLCPKGQIDRCRKFLEGTDSRVIPFDAPPAPWAKLVRAQQGGLS